MKFIPNVMDQVIIRHIKKLHVIAKLKVRHFKSCIDNLVDPENRIMERRTLRNTRSMYVVHEYVVLRRDLCTVVGG